MKKSGTGTLKTFLGYHSMVEITPGEKHFFDEDLKFNRGYEWYVQQMPLAADGQLVVEKTPKYFITPRAADELRKVGGWEGSPITRCSMIIRWAMLLLL